MSDTYLSLKAESNGLYKEKGSKFLAYAFAVDDEQQVQDKLQLLRKKHYDARHHCYAYVLGEDYESYRANDDGEPHHSAGDPILGQIRSKELTNTLIVVVRYFGGTKLGVGGLISAYKTAAKEALSQAKIKKFVKRLPLKVLFHYEQMSAIMKLVKTFDTKVIDQRFEESCELRIAIRMSEKNSMMEKLQLIPNVKFS